MNSDLPHGFVYEDENGKFAYKCCDKRFVKSELHEHISVAQSTPDAEILRLPVECLINIFRCLTPNQLINTSRVCRKFKAMVEKEFELHFDPGPIQITTGKIKIHQEWEPRRATRWLPKKPMTHESGKCRVKCDFVFKSKYQLAFSSLIRRLEVPWPNLNGVGYDKVFQFIRANCSKELISLSFSDYRSSLMGDSFEFDRRIYGEIARDQLKHLKHLRVKEVSFQYLYDELLQYTEHLKTLNVIHHCDPRCYLSEFRCKHSHQDCANMTHTHPVLPCPHFDSEWTNHTYPELESICVHTSDNQFDLMPMIRRHPKLRSVACNSLATIRSIFQSDVTFKYVAIIFTMGDRYQGIRSLHNDIVKFGQSKRFEKFEVALNGRCPSEIHRIEMIPNLTGLHPDYSILFDKQYITQLPHIEKLCFLNHNTNFREAADGTMSLR
ncbi:uncharacterized protein LOC119072322 [Bradysia coprophila]|uniref:uncharacterized protein LOC119072322 n=1 Tax=Bradysia coprophila TaxID=38358 RepID=UPI00187DAF83|nr:uncharacterized protein LOC119072322 [Bradysia coprophila]